MSCAKKYAAISSDRGCACLTRKRWDDGKFGETERVLLRFIQRASLAISCVSSPTSAKLVSLARLPLSCRVAPRRTVKTRSLRTSQVIPVNMFLHADENRSEWSFWLGKNAPRFAHTSFFRPKIETDIISLNSVMLQKKDVFHENTRMFNDTWHAPFTASKIKVGEINEITVLILVFLLSLNFDDKYASRSREIVDLSRFN